MITATMLDGVAGQLWCVDRTDVQGAAAAADRVRRLREELLLLPPALRVESDEAPWLGTSMLFVATRLATLSDDLEADMLEAGEAHDAAATRLEAACWHAELCLCLISDPDTGLGPHAEALQPLLDCSGLLLGPGRAVLETALVDDTIGSQGQGRPTSQPARPPGRQAALVASLEAQGALLHALLSMGRLGLCDTEQMEDQLAPAGPWLAWLDVASRAAVTVFKAAPGASVGTLKVLCFPVAWMFCTPCFDTLARAVQHDAATRQSVLSLLLIGLRMATVTTQLPAEHRPAGTDWQNDCALLAAALSSPWLQESMLGHLALMAAGDNSISTPGWRLFSDAAQLVASMPSEGMEQAAGAFYCCVRLLGAVCGHLHGMRALQQEGQGQQGRRQEAALLLRQAVERLGPMLADLLNMPSAGPPVSAGKAASAYSAPQACAAWLPAVQLLGCLVQVTVQPPPRGPAGGSGSTGSSRRGPAGTIACLDQLPGWCAAAAAMLQALPQLGAVHPYVRCSGSDRSATAQQGRPVVQQKQQQQQGTAAVGTDQPAAASAPACLATALVQAAMHITAACSAPTTGYFQRLTQENLFAGSAALWQLHSTLCRLTHWLAAGSGEQLGCSLAGGDLGKQLLAALNSGLQAASSIPSTFEWAYKAQRHTDVEGLRRVEEQLTAMCGAHLEAVVALAAPHQAQQQAQQQLPEKQGQKQQGNQRQEHQRSHLQKWQERQERQERQHLWEQQEEAGQPARRQTSVPGKAPLLPAGASAFLEPLMVAQSLLQAFQWGSAAPLLVSKPLQHCLADAVRGIPEMKEGSLEAGSTYVNMLTSAKPVVTAWLASTGVVEMALRHLASFAAGAGQDLHLKIGCSLVLAVSALEALAAWHRTMLKDSATQLTPAAAGEVQQQLAAYDAAMRPVLPKVQQANSLRRITHLESWELSSIAARLYWFALPPTKALARALLDLSGAGRSKDLSEARLELARVAATRSCAYLRCSNVGLQGGALAGQGAGCLKCGKCRAVWYCGTGCSHADWQAGHRKACAELAARRLQAKEIQSIQQQ